LTSSCSINVVSVVHCGSPVSCIPALNGAVSSPLCTYRKDRGRSKDPGSEKLGFMGGCGVRLARILHETS
jgi:hypothetical protein